jgi:hypothetical protein
VITEFDVGAMPGASRRVGRQGRTPDAGASGRGGAQRRRLDLHATRERDQKIAAGMGKLFTEAKKTSTKTTGTSPKPSGTQRARGPKQASLQTRETHQKAPLTCAGSMRADDGNRTRMTSLEGWGSTIELHPRDAVTRSLPGRGGF